jgi:hypothetical protein
VRCSRSAWTSGTPQQVVCVKALKTLKHSEVTTVQLLQTQTTASRGMIRECCPGLVSKTFGQVAILSHARLQEIIKEFTWPWRIDVNQACTFCLGTFIKELF